MKPTHSTRLRRIAALLVAAVAASAAIFMSTPAHADNDTVGFSWFGGGHRVTGSGKLANESRAVTGLPGDRVAHLDEAGAAPGHA